MGAHQRCGANARSSVSRARPLASGTRWPYRSTVVVIDLCPSQRDTSEIGTPSARAVLAKVCLLCGIPHKRHYADGWVMRPAVTFPLAGAAELVLQSA